MHPLQLETPPTPLPRGDLRFAMQSTRADADRASVLREEPRPNIVARFRSQSYGILRLSLQKAPGGGAHGRFQGAAGFWRLRYTEQPAGQCASARDEFIG